MGGGGLKSNLKSCTQSGKFVPHVAKTNCRHLPPLQNFLEIDGSVLKIRKKSIGC